MERGDLMTVITVMTLMTLMTLQVREAHHGDTGVTPTEEELGLEVARETDRRWSPPP